MRKTFNVAVLLRVGGGPTLYWVPFVSLSLSSLLPIIGIRLLLSSFALFPSLSVIATDDDLWNTNRKFWQKSVLFLRIQYSILHSEKSLHHLYQYAFLSYISLSVCPYLASFLLFLCVSVGPYWVSKKNCPLGIRAISRLSRIEILLH